MRCLMVVLGVLSVSACFSPDYPVGLSCDPAGWCPSGQICSNRNVCLIGDGDGGIAAFDADLSTADADPGLGALISVSIGDDVSLAVGGTHAFVVTGNYERGTEVISEFAIWNSSDMAVAFVDFNGVAHGQAVGVTTVSCDYMGRVDSAMVTVSSP